MSDIRKYRGAFHMAVIRVFVYGVLTGCAMELLALLILMHFPWDPAYWLYGLFHWPAGLFTGMAVSGCVVFSRRTTVEIGEGKIRVCSPVRRKCFDLPQFVDSSVKRKTHIGSYSKYTAIKCYFIFETPAGLQRCRLYGFREKELEIVLEAVRREQAACLAYEEKAAIVKEYGDEVSEALIQGREGAGEFLLPAAVLIRKERDYLKKISLTAAAVVTIVGILDIQAFLTAHAFSIQLAFLTILALAMAVLAVLPYAGLSRKKRICAERIVIDGEHLLVGRHYYSYSNIDGIRLTSPRKRNSSVFPVQRYLYVSAAGKTGKYWLGSEVSFAAYESLCGCLEGAMILYPDKLRFR